YRKAAVTQLATAYLQLAELQQQLGKRADAEESLKKGIDHGEKAVALEPGRPLVVHNLELARRMLDGIQEHALLEEVAKPCEAKRFTAVIELYRRSIGEQEDRVRSGKERDAARRLAHRLDRSAWFLAHCPDESARD